MLRRKKKKRHGQKPTSFLLEPWEVFPGKGFLDRQDVEHKDRCLKQMAASDETLSLLEDSITKASLHRRAS